MIKAERDRIEATLPPDRKYKMPPEMTDKMRGAAWDAFALAWRTSNGKIEWDDVCKCFVAAFEAGHAAAE
jgi:hypothetical protein